MSIDNAVSVDRHPRTKRVFGERIRFVLNLTQIKDLRATVGRPRQASLVLRCAVDWHSQELGRNEIEIVWLSLVSCRY